MIFDLFKSTIFLAFLLIATVIVIFYFAYHFYRNKNRNMSEIIINSPEPLYWTDCCDDELNGNENNDMINQP